MASEIKIIALDLDGTLLDSAKRLSEGNRAALEAAAAKGIHVVPTTGRFFGMMPEQLRRGRLQEVTTSTIPGVSQTLWDGFNA